MPWCFLLILYVEWYVMWRYMSLEVYIFFSGKWIPNWCELPAVVCGSCPCGSCPSPVPTASVVRMEFRTQPSHSSHSFAVPPQRGGSVLLSHLHWSESVKNITLSAVPLQRGGSVLLSHLHWSKSVTYLPWRSSARKHTQQIANSRATSFSFTS